MITKPKTLQVDGKPWLWFGFLFCIACVLLVPDWGDRRAWVGAVVGFVAFLPLIVLSYHANWRKPLTKKQLKQAQDNNRFIKTVLVVPCVVIGIYSARMIDGSGSAPYIKGGASILLLCTTILALVNAYAKKGLFQELPASRSTQQPKR